MKKLISILLLCVFVLLCGCNNNTTKVPSTDNINLENKKYFDSIIKESKAFENVNIEKKEREIIYAEKYEMDVSLDTENNTISGHSTIYIKNNSSDTVSSVVLRNYSVDGEESIINIDLDKALTPGTSTQITYDYNYSIPKKKNRYGYVKYEENTIYQLSSCFPMLSIYENGHWNENPSISDGAESNYTTVSDYDVNITVPKEYTVIATGSEEKIENGKYKVFEENLREFAMVVGNNLKKTTVELNGVKLNNYYYDFKGSKKYVDYSLEVMKASVDLYSKLIDEYPFGELDLVNCFMNSAMEYPGMIMLGYPDIKDIKNIDSGGQYDHILGHVSHEVAHQWFYGVVGNDPYNEAWLDESFAEYLEDFVFPISGSEVLPQIEKEKGKEFEKLMSIDNFYKLQNSFVEQQMHEKKINLPYHEFDRKNDEYSYYVYDGGARFLFELQQQLGDVKFLSMLQNYYRNYKFSEVTTNDFIAFVKKYANSKKVNKIIEKYVNL